MSYKLIIQPGITARNYWSDLWKYRELFYILTWRDIQVRYKQTVLGILWAVIRPLLTMIVFTFVFGKLAGMAVDGVAPYAIMVYAGLLPWQFFSNALTESSNSLIGNENLITKVYFPRLIIPASSVITSFVDFLISFVILLFIFLFYRYTPPLEIFFIPLFWLMAVAVSLGPGLLFTAWNVKYRDFRYIITFIVQFGVFISPVGYSSSLVPREWQWAYALNPMAGVIDGFRWCIVRDAPNPLIDYPFYISLSVAIVFILIGLFQFRKMEKNFADLI